MAKILGQDAKKLAAITLAIKILGQDLAQDRTQDFFTGRQVLVSFPDQYDAMFIA